MAAPKQEYSTIPCFSLKLVRNGNIRYPLSKVSNQEDAAKVFQAYLGDECCEHLAILLIDSQSNLIGVSTIAIGGLTKIVVSVRDIFNYIIAGRASSFILGHNHPSGDTTPSKEDINLTRVVQEAGTLMGVPLTDHVIVSSGITEKSYSFLANGHMI